MSGVNEWLISLSEYIGGMSDELDNAKAENAKLRDERNRMYKANVEKNGEILRLLEENANLRELVKRMHDHIKESCDICDEDYCSSWDEDNECCVFDTMLREVMVVRR